MPGLFGTGPQKARRGWLATEGNHEDRGNRRVGVVFEAPHDEVPCELVTSRSLAAGCETAVRDLSHSDGIARFSDSCRKSPEGRARSDQAVGEKTEPAATPLWKRSEEWSALRTPYRPSLRRIASMNGQTFSEGGEDFGRHGPRS